MLEKSDLCNLNNDTIRMGANAGKDEDLHRSFNVLPIYQPTHYFKKRVVFGLTALDSQHTPSEQYNFTPVSFL